MPERQARRVVHADTPTETSPSGLPVQHLVSEAIGAEQVFVAQQWLRPDDRVLLHTHQIEEALVFLSGSGEATLGGETVTIGTGVTLFVPPGIPHGFQNTGGRPLHVLVVFPGATFAETRIVEPDTGSPQETPFA